jgi:hypothetical protein
MRKDCIRHDVENDRADGIESRKCQPKKREQANVSLYSAGTGLGKLNRAYDLLAAVVAEPLAGLHRRAASIAEHDFDPPQVVRPECNHTPSRPSLRRTADGGCPYTNLEAQRGCRYMLRGPTIKSSVHGHESRGECYIDTRANEKATRQQGGLFFKGE